MMKSASIIRTSTEARKMFSIDATVYKFTLIPRFSSIFHLLVSSFPPFILTMSQPFSAAFNSNALHESDDQISLWWIFCGNVATTTPSVGDMGNGLRIAVLRFFIGYFLKIYTYIVILEKSHRNFEKVWDCFSLLCCFTGEGFRKLRNSWERFKIRGIT